MADRVPDALIVVGGACYAAVYTVLRRFCVIAGFCKPRSGYCFYWFLGSIYIKLSFLIDNADNVWSWIVFWELMDRLMGITCFDLVRWLADTVKKVEMDFFFGMIMRSIWFDRNE
ncbi:hypothetical protein Q3G72_000986 [Acer saccharum]|nr:hypothetical protein Q3G72_000986 [Acer saccharum]